MRPKRIISVLMSLVLVAAVFMPERVNAENSTIPEGMMYMDEFSGTALSSDWVCNQSGRVSNGTINSAGTTAPITFNAYLSGKDGASEWTDYSVEADVKLTDTDDSGNALAGVAVRSGKNKCWAGGYSMKLSYESGAVKLKLYSGDNSSTNKELKAVVIASSGEEIGQTYHLKLTVIGEILVGYVNGTEKITYTANDTNLLEKSATKNIKGYPGVIVNKGTVAIDNFVVTASDVLYADAFGMELTNDWTYSGSAEVADGTLNSVSETEFKTYNAWLNKEDGATTWKNYSVEADVKITKADNSNATVGLALYSTVEKPAWSGGYSMKLFYTADGVQVRFYSGDGSANTHVSPYASVPEGEVAIDSTFHMKMAIVDNSLLGYVNGKLVIAQDLTSITATKHTAGYPGLMVNTGLATFDNFVVTQIPDSSIVIGEVDASATVYVDGQQSAEAKATGIVQANPGQSVQIISDTQNTVYLVKADGSVVQPDFLQNPVDYVGVSVRVTGNQGIRFKTSITQNARIGDETFSLKEYGTIVTKDTILDGKDLYLTDAYKTVNGVAYDAENGIDLFVSRTDESIEFTGVLWNISEANYNTKYVGRAYAIYEDVETGTRYKIYGEKMEASLVRVAEAALNDTTVNYTDDQRTYLEGILNSVAGGQAE